MAQQKPIISPLWFAVPDLLFMFVGLHAALVYKYGTGVSREQSLLHYKVFAPLFLAWILILYVHNAFDPRSLRRHTTMFYGILSAGLVSFLASIVYFYFQPDLLLTPRRFLLVLTAAAFLLVLLWHLVMKSVVKNRAIEEYYLFSPNGELESLHAEMLSHSYLGFKVAGYADSEQIKTLNPSAKVIVAESIYLDPALAKQIYALRSRGAEIVGEVDFSERLLRRIPLSHVGEAWLLRNIGNQNSTLGRVAVRTFDILAGILLGLAFIVTYPFVALAIRLSSPGPIFFNQPRVGRNNEIFMVHKYRTMDSAAATKGWTQVNDSRITRVGKILRRLHLDELPQFVNLLAGNMSVVGPRPEQVEIVEELSKQLPFYNERHAIKPGITGWAQLNIYAGNLDESRRKLEYDLYYLKHRSFFFDSEILLKTLYSIFANKLK